MNNIFQGLKALLFPPKCIHCGKITALDTIHCGCPLPRASQDSCPLCGNEYSHCSCSFAFEKIVAPLIYKDKIRSMAIQLKTTPDKKVISFLGKEMTQCYNTHYHTLNFFALVPIPNTGKSFLQKGFNHAELLAKEVGKTLSIPVNTKLLYRDNTSLKQPPLKSLDRFINANESYFSVTHPEPIQGNLLLIDDICTTGATLNACAKELQTKHPNIKIYALTSCRTAYTHKHELKEG